MRVRRTPRIGSAEVERLIAGDPTGPDHDGLATLLAAARAPASPGELTGERAAVARFSAAYREEPVRPRRTLRRARVARPARAVGIKVAAATAALAFGGVAVAAETGNLPAPAQDRAHRLFSALGVPAPQATTPRPASPAARPTGTTRPPSARPTPAAPAPASPAPDDPAVPGLCRAWHAAQRDPRGAALPEATRRALTAAAGGPARVAALCAPHATASPDPTASTTPRPGRPSDPGKPSKPSKPPKTNKPSHRPGQ
jgi:hypothetical protein